VKPKEEHASQRAGSRPREEKDAVVVSSVVRRVEAGLDVVDERLDFEVEATGTDSEAAGDSDREDEADLSLSDMLARVE